MKGSKDADFRLLEEKTEKLPLQLFSQVSSENPLTHSWHHPKKVQTRKETFRFFIGLEELSSSIGWRVMTRWLDKVNATAVALRSLQGWAKIASLPPVLNIALLLLLTKILEQICADRNTERLINNWQLHGVWKLPFWNTEWQSSSRTVWNAPIRISISFFCLCVTREYYQGCIVKKEV